MKTMTFFIALYSLSLLANEVMTGTTLLKDLPLGSQFTFNGESIRKAKKVCDKAEKLSSFVDGKLVCVTSNHSLVERRFILNGNIPNKKNLSCNLVSINRKDGDAIELVFDGSCNFFSITVARADLDNFFTKRNGGEIEANSFNYNLGSFGEVHFDDFYVDASKISNSDRTPSLEKTKDTLKDITRAKAIKE